MNISNALPHMPICDYSAHPAFRDYATATAEESLAIRAALDALDNAFDVAARSRRTESLDEWRTQTQRVWNDIKEAVQRLPHLAEHTRRRCTTAVIQAAFELDAMVAYLCTQRNEDVAADEASRRVAEKISRDGIAVTRVPDSTVALLRSHLRDETAHLAVIARRDPRNRRMLPMRMAGAAWETVWSAINECGLVGGVSLHEQQQVKPMNWSLALNTPSERWYRDCYADVGIPTSPAAYMHYDHDFNFAKIQVYLSDVDLESAPFSYIPGSHLWKGSNVQQMIFKTLDSAFSDLTRPVGEDYYRLRFRLPEQRKQFMLLPECFRGTSHFGDDILEDSPLAEQLLPQERFVTSDVGNAMVFTGGKALHRGGLARSKERLVLQVGVSAVTPASWALQPRSLRQTAAENAGRAARIVFGEQFVTRAGRWIRSITG